MTSPATSPAEARTPRQSQPLLEARGITVSVEGRALVDGVDVSVAGGEVVGLVGPNGAGKSTLLRAATGVSGGLKPEAGTVLIDGRPIATYPRAELFRRVAVVQQLPDAPPSMTVHDLVLLGRFPHLGLFRRESERDHEIARAAMARTGCAALAERHLGTLSGGERRRAFIARALAQEPRLLLLDEPTANLDADAQAQVLELLRDLARAGVGVLVVLHDLTFAAAYCDRLLLMHGGRLVASGAPAEVLAPAHVAAVYGSHVRVLPHPDTGLPVIVPAVAAR